MAKAAYDIISTTNSIASTYYQAVSSRVCIIPTCYDTAPGPDAVLLVPEVILLEAEGRNCIIVTTEQIYYLQERTYHSQLCYFHHKQ